jgi:hypothetical protein
MDCKSGVSISALAVVLGTMTPAERAKGRYMRAPDGHEGGGGDGGAAAALAAAAAAGGDGGGGDGGAGGGDGGGGDGGAGGGGGAEADPEWLGQFSAEGGDAENPSNRDWLKSKGFKSLDDVAKSYRAAERAIHDKGAISVPGEGAKPEEISAFHKAIGVPEKADGYEFALPDGVTQEDLELDMISPLREVALKAGVPAKGFAALAEATVAAQLEQLGAMKVAEDGDFSEWKKAQGDQANAKLADANNAMRHLGLSPIDVQAMQRGYFMTTGKPGSAKVMDMLAKLGAGMAEDLLVNPGDSKRRFGISGAEAQAEIDKLVVDAEFGKKLEAKDPDAVARWTRLNAAVAAERDRQNAAARAG